MRRTGRPFGEQLVDRGVATHAAAPRAARVGDGLDEQAPRSISRTIRRSFTPWHRHTIAIAE